MLYKGFFSKHKKHGKGEAIYSKNGITTQTFKGTWKKGLKYGLGFLYAPDGSFKKEDG